LCVNKPRRFLDGDLWELECGPVKQKLSTLSMNCEPDMFLYYQPLQRLFGAVGQLYVYDLWPRHLARWFVLTLVVGQGHWSKFLVTGEKNSGVKHFFGYACTLPGDSKARAVKKQNWIENSK